MPWKRGGGGVGAQSNFPTRDHQKFLFLILIWSYMYSVVRPCKNGIFIMPMQRQQQQKYVLF